VTWSSDQEAVGFELQVAPRQQRHLVDEKTLRSFTNVSACFKALGDYRGRCLKGIFPEANRRNSTTSHYSELKT